MNITHTLKIFKGVLIGPTRVSSKFCPNGFIFLLILLITLTPSFVLGKPIDLQKGSRITQTTMVGMDGKSVNLSMLKGRVTLISVVPQLNTPVCDEQTHRFSEQNEGLDQLITIVTMSTNTYSDQGKFAKEAKINNMTFLSDVPDFNFGRDTGLLLQDIDILHRAVILLDEDSIIRYVEIVPMMQLPNFQQAYQAARRILADKS